jgi:STAS domain
MVVVISGPVACADLQPLCEGVGAAVERSAAAAVVCDVGALTDPDAGTVDTVVRLWLTARRLGCTFRVRNASPALRSMLELAGLCETGTDAPLRLGVVGQAEEREQTRRVEERRDPGDAAV